MFTGNLSHTTSDYPPWVLVASYFNCGPSFDLFNGTYPQYQQVTVNSVSPDTYSLLFTVVVTGPNAYITFPTTINPDPADTPNAVDLFVFSYQ